MIKLSIFSFLILFNTLILTAQTQEIPLFIGTYTQEGESKGIQSYLFNTKTAEVSFVSETKTSSPSFLAKTKNTLLAVNELVDGNQSISSFKIQGTTLTEINKLATTGKAPCHVVISKDAKYAIVSNYLEGKLDLYSLKEDGTINVLSDSKKYEGSSVNKSRQESSHIHSAFIGPDNLIYVSDLGTDKIYVLEVQQQDKLTFIEKELLATPKGGGPRHLAFHPNGKYLYSLMELTADVVVYEKQKQEWIQKQQINMNEAGFNGNNGAADIKVSKDGKYAYATNRADANTVTVFSVEKNGLLKKKQVLSVLGNGPRNFNLTPDEKFLLVANQNSNEVVIFNRNSKTGLLTDSNKRIKVFKPVCLLF